MVNEMAPTVAFTNTSKAITTDFLNVLFVYH